jgi:glutamate-1-semialdehyde 2,1-aminomutase
LLVKAGSGMATLAISDTVGVPQSFAETTIVLPFNDLGAVKKAFVEQGDRIACVIVEPVAGNMGCIPPLPGFLEGLRTITERYGALLIFDEVMTGFRLSFGGAQQLYNIKPDLSTIGKIVGGGLPIAAYGGRADIMSKVAPTGPIYQAGTLSGNPLAVSAGIAMLTYLKNNPQVYELIEKKTAALCAENFKGVTINRVGSMFTYFFTGSPVTDWDSAKKADTNQFKRFFHHMLENGVYLAPSQFEAGFLSYAHSDEDVRQTVGIAREFFNSART